MSLWLSSILTFICLSISRYLENGIWDMVATNSKTLTTHFACCDFPFYEVQFRLIFKRQPEFYVQHVIMPVILLCALSLMVFFLPTDSGEKVALCMTNFLALAVYQQIITENMPPSGHDSPIIGRCYMIVLFFFIRLHTTLYTLYPCLHTKQVPTSPCMT